MFLHVSLSESQLLRFWRKVSIGGPNDCWEWNRRRNDLGYGNVFIEGKCRLSHRIAYFIANGAFLDALKVCHTCDNPPCCNPAHLWLGTDGANVADRDAKGRLVNGKKYLGEFHMNAKLTNAQTVEIRRLYQSGDFLHAQLAQTYGVSKSTIQRITSGKRWRHLL